MNARLERTSPDRTRPVAHRAIVICCGVLAGLALPATSRGADEQSFEEVVSAKANFVVAGISDALEGPIFDSHDRGKCLVFHHVDVATSFKPAGGVAHPTCIWVVTTGGKCRDNQGQDFETPTDRGVQLADHQEALLFLRWDGAAMKDECPVMTLARAALPVVDGRVTLQIRNPSLKVEPLVPGTKVPPFRLSLRDPLQEYSVALTDLGTVFEKLNAGLAALQPK